MKLPLAFGFVIRKWRVARKLSQAQLAKQCELDRTFVSLLERGLRQPSLETIFSLCHALGAAPEEILRQTARKAQFTNDSQRRSLVSSKRL